MGSGEKRKSNDVVRINRPIKRGSGAGGGGGAGSSDGSSRDINELCLPAFEVLIKPLKGMQDGTTVTIKGDGLYAQGVRVGKLLPRHVQMMQDCVGEGIEYLGHVVNRTKGTYAHFEQRV